MTKKKRGHPDIEEILDRPWCYYCERDFDDLKILISHQKAKHFKCERCGRRLSTAGGLSVHMNQVHKESLTSVENALPNRSDVNIEIFGMEGIPQDVTDAHKQRVTEAFFRQEAERRAVTGNPPPGGKTGADAGIKKPKVESPEEIKKRLAEHKARKEAERLGLSSGGNTPSQDQSQSAAAAGSPHGPPFQAPFQPPVNSSSPPNFNPYQPPPQPVYPAFAGSPLNPPQFAIPQNPQMPPQPFQRQPTWPQQSPPNFQGGPPIGYHQGPSPGPYNQFPQPAYSPSGPPGSAPGMTPGLPQPSPGLPQRPAFNPPNLSKEEMAKMHAGMPAAIPHQQPNGDRIFSGQQQLMQHAKREDIGDSVDDLIKSVTGQGPQPQPQPPAIQVALEKAEPESTRATLVRTELAEPTPTAPVGSDKKEKKSKKHKEDKSSTRLIYSDNKTSPEEKKALKSKYAFKREDHTELTLIGAGAGDDDNDASVTRVVGDTVRDPQDAHLT